MQCDQEEGCRAGGVPAATFSSEPKEQTEASCLRILATTMQHQ